MSTTAFAPSAAPSATALTTWQIDPAHTDVSFAVKHLMISTVKGRFSDVKGTLRMAGDDLTTGSLDVTIGVGSLDTRVEARDAHLRSVDFFDVENHPTLTFTSRRVEAISHGHYTLVGDMTVRGVTREVSLDVVDEGRVRDPWGGDRAGFSLTTTISRKDFGLTWNQLLEAGGVAVGDAIKIHIETEVVKG